mgnify:FL=1
MVFFSLLFFPGCLAGKRTQSKETTTRGTWYAAIEQIQAGTGTVHTVSLGAMSVLFL